MITGQGIVSEAHEARRISPDCTSSRIAVTYYIYNKIVLRECDDCNKYCFRSYKAPCFLINCYAIQESNLWLLEISKKKMSVTFFR